MKAPSLANAFIKISRKCCEQGSGFEIAVLLGSAEMRFALTRIQTGCLIAVAAMAGFTSFTPHYGQPFFRYTGSDLEHHVWNFGYPLSVFIYDSATAPYLFHNPLTIIYGLLWGGGIPTLYFTMLAWNNRAKIFAQHKGTPNFLKAKD